jgi:hypothetical protein
MARLLRTWLEVVNHGTEADGHRPGKRLIHCNAAIIARSIVRSRALAQASDLLLQRVKPLLDGGSVSRRVYYGGRRR